MFSWEGSVYSSTLSIFTTEGGLDNAFLKVGEQSLWGSTTPVEDDKICSEYDGCIISLYECFFSTMGVHLPFTAYEVGVFNHIMVAPSQLYP